MPMRFVTSQFQYCSRIGLSKPYCRSSSRRYSSVTLAVVDWADAAPSAPPMPRMRIRRISMGPPGRKRVRLKQRTVMPRKVGITSRRRRAM